MSTVTDSTISPAPCADAIKNDQSVRPPIPTRMARLGGQNHGQTLPEHRVVVDGENPD
jgi:hypothetical protein